MKLWILHSAVTYAAAKHQGHLFWITCKWLKLLRKAGCLQLIQNSAPSVARRCQRDIRIENFYLVEKHNKEKFVKKLCRFRNRENMWWAGPLSIAWTEIMVWSSRFSRTEPMYFFSSKYGISSSLSWTRIVTVAVAVRPANSKK